DRESGSHVFNWEQLTKKGGKIVQGRIPKKIIIDIKIPAIIEQDEFGFFAYSDCPGLKGLIADGKTEEEVSDNFKDASICYIKSLLKHKDPLPLGSTVYVKKTAITKPRTKDVEIPLSLGDKCFKAV
ncbi:unnamed protein product, partial [marine sediment metagenome]